MKSPARALALIILATAVIAGTAAVIGRISASSSPVNTATVYSGDLAAVTLAVTLITGIAAWWRKARAAAGASPPTVSQLASAADRLADVMACAWRQEATRRRIVTPAPAAIRWRWTADETTSALQEVSRPPAPGAGPAPLPPGEPGTLLRSGVVTRLLDEVYARLPHGRLILLGGPGAGKTGAMILLMLAALSQRAGLPEEVRAGVPVPVWLPLGGWDPAARTLHEWAAATIYRDHPFLRAAAYGADAAGELLRGGRVALFLDGLDEMPKRLQPHALRHIDQARGLRLVMTSRTAAYQQAASAFRPGQAAVIELLPVRPRAAAAYLLRDVGPGRSCWEQLAASIRDNPQSAAAQALDNPLTLSLARDVYAGHDPSVLADTSRFESAGSIRKHLIERVLATAYPRARDCARATRRLAWIARHMGSGRDLRWWEIPSWLPWRIRLARCLGFALAGALGVGIAFGPTSTPFMLVPGALAGMTWGGLSFGLAFGVSMGVAGGLAAEPQALTPRWPRLSHAGPILAFGVAGAAGFGLVGWIVEALAFGGLPPAPEVGLGAASGLVFGLGVGILNLWATPLASSLSATPMAAYKSDRRTVATLAIGTGVGIGLIFGLAFGVTGPQDGLVSPAIGVAYGLGFGIAGLLTAGLAFGQVPLIKLAELLTAGPWQRPVHFLAFLEDARDRQVLRQAGTVYQFRHAALQDHLIDVHGTDKRPWRRRGERSPRTCR